MNTESEKIGRKAGMRKLGSNMIIFTIGSFANKLMGYFLLPFYTSILSEAEYGTYDMIITTITLLFPFLTLMITESTMRYALEEHKDKRKVFTLSLLVTSASVLLFTLLSPLFLMSSIYRDYFVFFWLYYLVYTVHTLIAQFVKGIEETKAIAISGILGTFVTLVLNIVLMAVVPLGLVGYFIATIVGFIFSTGFLFFKCNLRRYMCMQ